MTHHNHALRYRTQYFVMGMVLAALAASTLGYAQRYRADEAEISKLRLAQINAQLKTAEDVQKVKVYYQRKNPKLWDSLALEMAQATVEAARFYAVPLEVQVGVNSYESDVSPFAVSPTGAKGMGQVDFTAWKKELGEGNPFEPRYNQRGVGYVLSLNIRMHGLRKGLEVYNVGEGSYRKGRRNHRYVARVFEQASEFRYLEM